MYRSARFSVISLLALVTLTAPVWGNSRVNGAALPADAQAGSPINLKALYHDTYSTAYRSPFGAVPAGSHVVLKLRTAAHGASSVSLNVTHQDQNHNPTGTSQQALKLTKHTKKYDYWSTTLTPAQIGIDLYSFHVKKGSASAWYGGTASSEGGPGQASKKVPAAPFPLTVYDPNFKVPSWTKNMVIYQIFPDRFYNGDSSNDTKGMNPVYGGTQVAIRTDWGGQPSAYPQSVNEFFGGDLQGVIDKLPYLKSLGVNTLYLNPIFLAPSNHKYDTSDFLTIDPRFGTMDTFNKLVAALHTDGMHLILDGVFNHTGSDSVYFNRYGTFPDVGAYQSKTSNYYPWYQFLSWPGSYRAFDSVSGSLPQLQEIDPVKDFIFRRSDSVAQTWLSKGADGWRLDAAQSKSHQWWQQFRGSVKAAYPDSLMICECTADPIDQTPWLLGNEFDGGMNYRWRGYILDFFNGGAGFGGAGIPYTAHGFYKAELGMLEEYPPQAVSMNLLTSHDSPRILGELADNLQREKEIVAFQMTWPGAPSVYFGDEAGQTNSTSADQAYLARNTFPWDHQNTDLETYYRNLITLRTSHPALTDGSVSPLVLNDANHIVSYLRSDNSEKIAVILNNDLVQHKVTVTIPRLSGGAVLKDAISGRTYKSSGGKVSVTLKRETAAILLASGT
jgi:glycosidase